MFLRSFWTHFTAIQAPYWLFAIGIFLAVWYMEGKKNPAGPAFIAYLVLVYTTAVFSRDTNNYFDYKLIPFWSYYHLFKDKNYFLLVENVLNIIMMIPVGFLVPFIDKKYNLKKCIYATIAIEVFIELSQLVLRKGLCEWDDVINGIVGCIIGYGMYKLVRRIVSD